MLFSSVHIRMEYKILHIFDQAIGVEREMTPVKMSQVKQYWQDSIEVALRMAQPPQTKEVKQKSTTTAYSTLNTDNHVTGDSSRSRYEDLPTESPTAIHSWEKTSNSVLAQNVREMVTTQVSKQVKLLTNQETELTCSSRGNTE